MADGRDANRLPCGVPNRVLAPHRLTGLRTHRVNRRRSLKTIGRPASYRKHPLRRTQSPGSARFCY